MLKRIGAPLLLAAAAVLGGAHAAQAQQTLNFTVGYFTPRGADARVEGDVLNANRTLLSFDVKDFNSATVGGEWLIPFGPFIEGGAGLSFTRRTVPSVYTSFVDLDGGEIEQEMKLRRIPIDFTVRVLPLGQGSAIQPYIGGGLSVINWRYSESGEFVDFGNANEIFQDTFAADGNATGPVVLAGVRFAGEAATGGFEIRYHSAKADLPGDFLGSKIDLGGWAYQATIGFRFR